MLLKPLVLAMAITLGLLAFFITIRFIFYPLGKLLKKESTTK